MSEPIEELKGNEPKREKVRIIPVELIDDFPEHPFQVKDDESMAQLVSSIEMNGVLNPVILRKKEGERYEIIAGHRRKYACRKLDIKLIPSIVRELSREDAMLAADSPDSSEQIRRYVRLTELTPELLEFVDEGKIGMRPAVELSYLQEEEMRDLVDYIDTEGTFPSHAQTIRMRGLSKEGKLDTDAINTIMNEEKPNQKARIKIPMEKIEKYFPVGTSEQKIEETIIKALALYRQRQKENRDAR